LAFSTKVAIFPFGFLFGNFFEDRRKKFFFLRKRTWEPLTKDSERELGVTSLKLKLRFFNLRLRPALRKPLSVGEP
jgi:hypothetical protein